MLCPPERAEHRAPAALQQRLSNTRNWHQALGKAPVPQDSQGDLNVTCEGKGQSHRSPILLRTHPTLQSKKPTAKPAGNYSECFGGLVSVVIWSRELSVPKQGKG